MVLFLEEIGKKVYHLKRKKGLSLPGLSLTYHPKATPTMSESKEESPTAAEATLLALYYKL
jgi:hypothetical protein